MTIEELILQEIEKTPRKNQSDLQKKYVDLYTEKEHYRKDAIYWEQTAKKYQSAYRKLKEKYEEKRTN